jgi:hypothetical protein
LEREIEQEVEEEMKRKAKKRRRNVYVRDKLDRCPDERWNLAHGKDKYASVSFEVVVDHTGHIHIAPMRFWARTTMRNTEETIELRAFRVSNTPVKVSMNTSTALSPPHKSSQHWSYVL